MSKTRINWGTFLLNHPMYSHHNSDLWLPQKHWWISKKNWILILLLKYENYIFIFLFWTSFFLKICESSRVIKSSRLFQFISMASQILKNFKKKVRIVFVLLTRSSRIKFVEIIEEEFDLQQKICFSVVKFSIFHALNSSDWTKKFWILI